ncbi:MAG: hypothetical protein F6K39_14850 [Okeania sp. SIO3B3]|nr:hypothetical protein [Okeania sp. SIO3B3]
MSSLEIRELRLGDSGDQVTKLQTRLQELGYYQSEIDGRFGGFTHKGVRLFQVNEGMDDDGVVDDDVWLHLFGYRSSEPIKDLKGSWPNFTTNEIVNPLFDHCPAKKWNELPVNVQQNLSHTMDLVQEVRSFLEKPIRINSTWRPKSNGSAHQTGKAVDLQLLFSPDLDYLNIMNWLQNECSASGFRAILEWKGKNPWLHLDRNFRDQGGKVFAVMFPVRGKMHFRPYEGRLPQTYV